MKDIGIDISDQTPKSVDEYLNDEWDYVITVCDEANETCPLFNGKVKNRLHMGFQDPSKAVGTDEFIWSEFLRVRDEIKEKFYNLWLKNMY
jgi:arsenate reductase